MRIVVATRAFAPEPAAAAWRHGALVRELTERGHDVTVLTSRLPDAAAGRPETVTATVRRAPVLRDRSGNVRGYVQYASFDLPLAVRLLVGALAHGRPDVVVVEPPPTTGAVVRVVCTLLRVPYVYYAADLLSYAAAEAGVNRGVLAALRAGESWVLRGAARVLTVSPGYVERVLALGAQAWRVVEVGTGVDTDRLRPVPSAPSGPSHPSGPSQPSQPTVVYAGTMSELQGTSLLVEALGRVLPTVPRARAIFYGGGVEAEQLARRAAEVAPGQIEFRGLASLEEIAEVSTTARAGLACQRPDTGYAFAFLVKPLAATACGTPVVYAGAGVMASLVREAGLGWAVAWDVDEVAEALRQALTTEPTPAERARLVAWTRERYSLRAVAVRAADAVTAAAR